MARKIQQPKEVEVLVRSFGGNPLLESAETNDHEEISEDLLRSEMPGWLQDFKENLVDESVPGPPRSNPLRERHESHTSSSSSGLPMPPRAKVDSGSGKHSVDSHFGMSP